MFIDVRKAHLNPVCGDDVYMELPEECGESKDVCGKLNFWLYGFRKAASAWESHYSGKFEEVGFERGLTCGVVFYHPGRDLSLVVHGDDFTFCGVREDLDWIRGLMEEWYEIKFRGILGSGHDEVQEITILGRTIRWTSEGIEYQADERQKVAHIREISEFGTKHALKRRCSFIY